MRTPRWLDVRLVFGVILVLAAVLLGAKVVTAARHTERRLAVTQTLAAGTVLQRSDLTRVDVRLPHGTRPVYLADPDDAVGRRLNRALGQGELVPADALSPADARTTISVPLPARSSPQLRRGQRIEVWLSTPTCSSTVLLPDVAVQEVHAGSDLVGAGPGQDVVISVSPMLADRVVAALADDDAVIRAGVLTSPAAASPADADLPDLAPCLGPAS